MKGEKRPHKIQVSVRIDPRDMAKAKELGIDIASLFRIALAIEIKARERELARVGG